MLVNLTSSIAVILCSFRTILLHIRSVRPLTAEHIHAAAMRDGGRMTKLNSTTKHRCI